MKLKYNDKKMEFKIDNKIYELENREGVEYLGLSYFGFYAREKKTKDLYYIEVLMKKVKDNILDEMDLNKIFKLECNECNIKKIRKETKNDKRRD